MLGKIRDRQWALADIDWDAPGAETIDDEFRPRLKAFMADLTWIENVGARGFAAMANKAPTETLVTIYRYFHAEEQRHANAPTAERLARVYLRRQVRDRWLRRQLTPNPRFGRAPVLISDDYYSSLQRANCKLITWPIAGIDQHTVRTSDGIEHRVDCIMRAAKG